MKIAELQKMGMRTAGHWGLSFFYDLYQGTEKVRGIPHGPYESDAQIKGEETKRKKKMQESLAHLKELIAEIEALESGVG